MIVLIGFMAAGKTTIGRRLAQRLGVPFLDSDLLIEQRQGRAIPEIFATDGELTFRDIEEATIASVLTKHDGVLSLGGGSLTRDSTRERLAGHTVIMLDVTLETAIQRIGDQSQRPMLRHGVEDLYERRAGTYRQAASLVAPTDGRTVDQIVNDLVARLTPSRLPRDTDHATDDIVVRSGGRSFPILVGSGLTDILGDVLPALAGGRRGFVVCQAPEPGLTDGAVVGKRVSQGLSPLPVRIVTTPAEPVETQEVALISRLTRAGWQAGDVLVAAGGRAILDLTARVSTGLPGPRLVYLPTTLEAQADSTAGGRHESDREFRSVRARYQPEAVVCDLSLSLWTPRDEGWRDGLAELVKQGYVLGSGMLDPLTALVPRLADRDLIATARMLRRGHNLKAASMSGDWVHERTLALGRPFAEAICRVTGPLEGGLALGLLAAAHVSSQQGRLSREDTESMRQLLDSLGLATRCDDLDPEAATAALQLAGPDAGLELVLLDGPGRPVPGQTATTSELVCAFARLRR